LRALYSLGAFHLMTRVLDRLAEKYNIAGEARVAARAAALLHDVGHGSFSHVMEKVLGFHHESWSVKVILGEETELAKLLRSLSTTSRKQWTRLFAHGLPTSANTRTNLAMPKQGRQIECQ
jgi:HD superfamily phosphohydrolase